ncbi:MAG: RNA polymerase subunit sigma-70 [Oleiphilus sp.]|nr:MAG: RNA polymerase subunit sigma-70 [Oleiphilus sp.]
MKESAKAKRIKRHQRRGKNQGKLNLVSLMDIFTILVFFLMVNSSSDVQVLNQDKSIKLPVSSADQMPVDSLSLAVTGEDILVGGRPIVKVTAMRAHEGDVEPLLKAELDYQASRARIPEPEQGRPITIVADKEIPYELLKKIMSTCVDAGYASISLAVNRQVEQEA